jgi:hypothetical protein
LAIAEAGGQGLLSKTEVRKEEEASQALFNQIRDNELSLESSVVKSKKDSRLEDSTNEKVDTEVELDDTDLEAVAGIDIEYGFQQEELAKNFYKPNAIDYVKMFYGEGKKPFNFESEDDYWAEMALSGVETDELSVVDAQETMRDIQYAAALNTLSEVSQESKRRFDMWIKFNPGMFAAFESLYSLTKDVDYAPLR